MAGDGAGGATAAGAAGVANAGGLANGGSAALGITKDAETLVSRSGVTIVSFGGYLNGESFQQEGILSFKRVSIRSLVEYGSARRARPQAASKRRLVCLRIHGLHEHGVRRAQHHLDWDLRSDGTIHLAFNHHVSTLHYRKSIAGVATSASAATWGPTSFSAVSSQLVANTSVTQLTYPKFVSEPGGSKLLFDARLGSSSSGDEYLWEYDGTTHAWKQLGRYIYGTGDSINAYPHGVSYGRSGTRLYVSWCWRETPDAQTNHDLLYIYSDDNGRTWKNGAGNAIASTGSAPVTKSTAGISVWPIKQNRGLINSEHTSRRRSRS